MKKLCLLAAFGSFICWAPAALRAEGYHLEAAQAITALFLIAAALFGVAERRES